MYNFNTVLYKYTVKELNDFEKYQRDLRKRMLIHAIEEHLNELNELCHSETFYPIFGRIPPLLSKVKVGNEC